MTSSKSDLPVALALGLVAMVVYGATVPTGLMGADNAEFVTLSATEGVAHPPGYPLYTLYLRALAWLPASGAAHAAGLATALLGAATVALLFAGLRGFGFRRDVASLAAVVVAVDLSVWSMHSHAEVFALNNLIAAAILWASAPESRKGLARAATLGLLAGLGLANHHSIVLLAPLGLWGLWRAGREMERAWLAPAVAVVTGCLGLTPYLYLMATAPDCIDCLQWGRLDGFGDLVAHFTRADYGTTQLKPDGTYDPLAQWGAFGSRLFSGTYGLVVLASVVGAFAMRRERRGLLLAAGGSFALAGLLFVGIFNIEPEGIGAQLVSRFYALPVLMLTPLVAAGLSALVDRFDRRALAGVAVATLLIGAGNASTVLDQHNGVIDAYLHDTFQPLPEDAIVFGTGDHRTLGAAYLQLVEEQRTDVDWVDAQLLAYDWYVERAEKRLGRQLPRTDEDGIPILEFVSAAVATGRPVFIANRFVDALDKIPSYPIGTVIRVLPAGERPPPPGELAAKNAELFAQFQLDTPISQVESPWEREVYHYYRRPWESLADIFERMGNDESARRASQMMSLYLDDH